MIQFIVYLYPKNAFRVRSSKYVYCRFSLIRSLNHLYVLGGFKFTQKAKTKSQNTKLDDFCTILTAKTRGKSTYFGITCFILFLRKINFRGPILHEICEFFFWKMHSEIGFRPKKRIWTNFVTPLTIYFYKIMNFINRNINRNIIMKNSLG